jgi:hypothetical protein
MFVQNINTQMEGKMCMRACASGKWKGGEVSNFSVERVINYQNL